MKIENLILFILVFYALVVLSCKKKEQSDTKTGTGATTTTGSTTSAPTNTASFDLSNCYGELSFVLDTSLSLSGGAVGSKIVDVRFYSSSYNNSNRVQVDAGTVNMNGTVLKKYFDLSYSDSTHTLYRTSNFNFSTSGNIAAPAVNFFYSGGNTNFADTSLIPTAITRTLGLNLLFTNFVNADSAEVSIVNDDSHRITKNFAMHGANSVSLIVTPAELNALGTIQWSIYIRVRAIKRTLVRANNGRDYMVYFSHAYTRYNVALN